MNKYLAVMLAAFLFLVPLLLVEAGVRVLIATDRLPEADSSNVRTDVSLMNVQRRAPSDVLILGASVIRSGIEPKVLRNSIKSVTGDAVSVQNAAQAAMSLGSQAVLVKGLAERELLPGVAIIGLTPTSLLGGTWDGDWFADSPLGQLYAGCQHVDEPEARLDCEVGQISALWRWRGQIDRIEGALEGQYPTTARSNKRVLRADGFMGDRPLDLEEIEALLPETMAKIPRNVRPSDESEADFVALVEALRAEGVDVVVVALPYTRILEDALLERNLEWREQLDAGYARLEEAADVDIVQVQKYGRWWGDGSSADLRHLSRDGAGPFTKQLWQMSPFREALLESLVSES